MRVDIPYSRVAPLLGGHGKRFHRFTAGCPVVVRVRIYRILTGREGGLSQIKGVGEATRNILNEEHRYASRYTRSTGRVSDEFGLEAIVPGANFTLKDLIYLSVDNQLVVDCCPWHWGVKTIKALRDAVMRQEGFLPRGGGENNKIVELRMLLFQVQNVLGELAGTDRTIGRQYTEETVQSFRDQGLLNKLLIKESIPYLIH